MGYKSYKAQDFINVIPGSGGIISTIAKRVGCDWKTAQRYIERHETVRVAFDNECETVDDMAESQVIKSIQSGNTQDAKWWLSRRRSSKFSEKHILEHTGRIDVTKLSDDELLAIAEA